MPETCRRRGRRVALAGVGDAAAQVCGGRGRCASPRPSRAQACPSAEGRVRRDDRRVPGALRHAARSTRCGQTPARLQSGGVAVRRTRARPPPLEGDVSSRTVAEGRRPHCLPPCRPRRRRHRGQRGLPRRTCRVRTASGSRCASSVPTRASSGPGGAGRSRSGASSTASSSRTTGSRRSWRPRGWCPRWDSGSPERASSKAC